jgi:uncharacterized protein (TIGR04255 family)
MAQERHLSRAPITEAVIDLRCKLGPEFDLAAFHELQRSVDYGEPKQMKLFAVTMRQEAGKDLESRQLNHGLIGWKFTSADRKQVVQFRKDGFTFSRLAPYTHWEDVFEEASRLFSLYTAAARPEEISRPAVRYINRLPLPESEVGDFSPYLTAPPPCPPGPSGFLHGFLTRVQLHDPTTEISATITQSLQAGGTEPGIVPVILDLDIYDRRTYPANAGGVLPRFDALRKAKNGYFFSSITEKTAAFFE